MQPMAWACMKRVRVSAFEELVRCYLDLVQSTVRRLAAEDIANDRLRAEEKVPTRNSWKQLFVPTAKSRTCELSRFGPFRMPDVARCYGSSYLVRHRHAGD